MVSSPLACPHPTMMHLAIFSLISYLCDAKHPWPLSYRIGARAPSVPPAWCLPDETRQGPWSLLWVAGTLVHISVGHLSQHIVSCLSEQTRQLVWPATRPLLLDQLQAQHTITQPYRKRGQCEY